jgi:hypothetical protein
MPLPANSSLIFEGNAAPVVIEPALIELIPERVVEPGGLEGAIG